MKRNSTVLIALVLLIHALSGCATIFNNKTSRVAIRTEPAGIKASTMNDGKPLECVTDCFFELKNDEDHVIRFEDPDIFTTQRTVTSSITGWFYANLLIGVSGVLLMGVDWLTDSMYSLSHDEVYVEFIDDEDDEEKEKDGEDEEDIDDEFEEDDEDYGEDNVATDATAPGSKPSTAAPPPVLDQTPTGVAALPMTTVEDREQIERVVPPSRIAQAIRNYYGELDEKQQQVVRERIYRIMKNQQATSGSIDLDQAIAIETHDRLR